MTTYKHLLIDLDNTIWDFESNSETALKEIFFSYQLDKQFDSFSHFNNLFSEGNHQLWAAYCNKQINKKQLNFERFNYPLILVGIQNETLALSLGTDYLQIYPTKTVLMPHALELLEYLKNKYHLHILSNGFSEVQYTKLKHAKLESYFDKIILSEMVGVLKPNKRIFEYAIKSLNARKKETLMIGDNFETDIRGAKDVGIDQIYYQINADKELSFTPTYTITSLLEILKIL